MRMAVLSAIKVRRNTAAYGDICTKALQVIMQSQYIAYDS